eukprot:scaffold60912_cov17-Tisochrysis_lutea.AAC.1
MDLRKAATSPPKRDAGDAGVVCSLYMQCSFHSFKYQAPLSLAKQLMAVSLDIRDSFDDVKGAETVMHLHKQHPDHMVLQVTDVPTHAEGSPGAVGGRDSKLLMAHIKPGPVKRGHLELQAELARMAECACFKEEQNKEQLMLAGYGLGLAELLQQ